MARQFAQVAAGDGPLQGRPKWMRTITYDRLLEAWHDAGERRDEIYDDKIAGCIARLNRLGG